MAKFGLKREIYRWEEKDGSRRTSKSANIVIVIGNDFWTTLVRLLIIMAAILS